SDAAKRKRDTTREEPTRPRKETPVQYARRKAMERAAEAENRRKNAAAAAIRKMLQTIDDATQQRIFDCLVAYALERIEATSGVSWLVCEFTQRFTDARVPSAIINAGFEAGIVNAQDVARLTQILENLYVEYARVDDPSKSELAIVIFVRHLLQTCYYDRDADLTLHLDGCTL